MRLDEFKEAQIEEIMEWADDLEHIITPNSVTPEHLKDFPLAMEISTRLKKICKSQSAKIKEKLTEIEDILLDAIEQQEYIFKFNGGGQPVTKKKFATAEQRKRELRRRLAFNDDYRNLRDEQLAWEMMYSDWVAHHERLRREMHLLEMEYNSSGSSVWKRDNDSSFITNKNRESRASS